jgi:hypothetical protein
MVVAMCAVSRALWGQGLPMWDPPDAGRMGVGQWAVTPVSTRFARVEVAEGWAVWQGQTPLRRSSCWAVQATLAQSGSIWSSSTVQITHEQALAPGWETRFALGADRTAWPEVHRVNWSPEVAWSLFHRSGDWMAGGWFHWQVDRSQRVPVTGMMASGDWGDWSATGLLLSTRSFSAWVSRTVHPGWRIQFGWRSDPVCFVVGVQGSFGSFAHWSWGCEQAAWGGVKWRGHVEVR